MGHTARPPWQGAPTSALSSKKGKAWLGGSSWGIKTLSSQPQTKAQTQDEISTKLKINVRVLPKPGNHRKKQSPRRKCRAHGNSSDEDVVNAINATGQSHRQPSRLDLQGFGEF